MNRKPIEVIHSFPIWLPQTQTWMYYQVKYLPETIDVHVVCEQTEHLEQFSVPNIHCLQDVSYLRVYLEKGLRKLRLRTKHSFLKSIASQLNRPIVHSHFGHIGWMNLPAIRALGLAHVVTFYGADVNKLPTQDKKWLSRYKELFEQADAFLCEGTHMAGQLMSLGCPEGKITVHHLGIETELLPYEPRIYTLGDPLRVLIAAGFREKKGITYALEALSRLQHMAPVEITIIGDSDSKPENLEEKRKILEIIQKSGLGPKTRLLGYQPYSVLFQEAYKHHVFLSPSVVASDGDTEGGAPVSIIEMMATGMPIVSTSHCDIPGVVQYGIDDWLAKERDVDGLVDRFQWLIKNVDKWGDFLDTGRRHIETEFNADLQGKKLEGIYRDCLSS